MDTLKEGDKRLDRTLSSEAFAYKDSVSRIVKNHLLKSSLAEDDPKEQLGGKHVDEITRFWSSKIYALVDDLRSASAKHTGKLKPTDETGIHSREWKLKDETERCRVMYREGPVGTPFHELCLDGVVDGDVASALCVAWESPIFKEWWPHVSFPKFEIVESKYLKRVRVGQDLSLLRFKIPWPLAQREVIMSAFEVEYLEDDLIIGLIESIPETIELSEKFHGFSNADVPPSSAHVRIDLGGGFVMQRISKDQFYFRSILSVDMKLDFVPPWLINFITRQVAGQGLKLYQKAVLAVTKGTGSGKAFQKPLKTGVMYERVRSGLEARKEAIGDIHADHLTERPSPLKDNSKAKSLQGSILRMGNSEYTRVVPYPVKPEETKESSADRDALITVKSSPPIVESAPERYEDRDVKEVKTEDESIGEIKPDIGGSSTGVIPDRRISVNEEDHREYCDAEVEWAVSVLDKMISYTRSCVAEQATAPQSLEIQSSSITLTKEAESREALVESSRKHPGISAKKDSCKIVVVKPRTVSNAVQESDNVEISRLKVLQSAGGDAESSSHSDFWSASEIEVVSSLDDTDTDGGGSACLVAGQPKAELQMVVSKRRRRKWRWACFSAGIRRSGHGRANFYAQGSATASEGNLRSRMGESARYTDVKRFQSASSSLRARSQSPDRFVTLGDMLLDKKR